MKKNLMIISLLTVFLIISCSKKITGGTAEFTGEKAIIYVKVNPEGQGTATFTFKAAKNFQIVKSQAVKLIINETTHLFTPGDSLSQDYFSVTEPLSIDMKKQNELKVRISAYICNKLDNSCLPENLTFTLLVKDSVVLKAETTSAGGVSK